MNIWRNFTLLATAAFALALTAGSPLRADDTPAAPPATDKKPEAAAPAVAAPAVAAPPAAPAVPEKAGQELEAKAESATEQIAAKTEAEAEEAMDKAHDEAEAASEKAANAVERAQEKARAAIEKAARHGKHGSQFTQSASGNNGDKVAVNDDNHVADGEVVPHDAVAIMGNLTVDGEVMHDAVAVMGDNNINGTVHHDAVAVMGNINLGPNAKVDGKTVCIMGSVNRNGTTESVGITATDGNFDSKSITTWWTHALKYGRPLAIGAHLAWLWILTAFTLVIYLLMALLLPKPMRTCGDKLVQEPGMVILAGVISILALPVLFVLLLVTIIGIPVAILVLPLGTLLVAMFGKAAVYGLVGRRLSGDRYPIAISMLFGAGLFILLYLVPVLGLICSLVVSFLGLGCAIMTIFSRAPKTAPGAPVDPNLPPVTPAAASVVPAPAAVVVPLAAVNEAGISTPAPVQASDAAVPVTPVAPSPSPEPVPAPAAVPTPAPAPAAPAAFTADTLPRAGFWIRVAAAFLDFILIAIVTTATLSSLRIYAHDGPAPMFLVLAVYHAAMWKYKGTTIGGVICHLKVVRIDDRPIDWGVAIVRALTAFLSFFMAGLGFIWVAFDDSRQSWHDRVAGTTIVRVPRGTPLL